MHMKNNSYHNEVKNNKSYLWTGGIISREFFYLFLFLLRLLNNQTNMLQQYSNAMFLFNIIYYSAMEKCI
jgi:hypothetical protein